ncbi:MAG TPA: TIGR03936 family radical SAM-associated protein, partial [Chroococcales cyanobacterium]
MKNMNIRQIIEKDLVSLNRPARYLGNEWGAIHKEWTPDSLAIALAFPDLYEVGMSHFGSRIAYDRFNRLEGVLAERVYAPDEDLEKLLRERSLPLFALESGRSLLDFDAVAFSLSYELTYTNLLNMLDLAGIPISSEERKKKNIQTLVFAGGPSCNNPGPLSDFLDFFAIGDGEELIEEICEILKKKLPRKEKLEALSLVEGIFVPSLVQKTRKRIVSELRAEDHPVCGPIPYLPIVHERVTAEVRRGCDRGCRFCQAGSLYLPVRERSADTAVRLIEESLERTGYEEFSLFSLSSSDYSVANEVAARVLGDCSKNGVNMSLPSMRVDSFSQELVKHQVRRTTLTFAPEAGSQRLRDVINKGVDEEEILSSISAAYQAGWNELKLYFMIGLPTETEEDLSAISELVASIKRRAQEIRRSDRKPRPAIRLNVTISTFVPKPHTPFQWRRQDTPDEIRAKQRFLVDKLRAQGVSTSYHDPVVSELECVISRGDRSVGKMIQKAWELGCRQDAWSEHFRPELWAQAARETNTDFEHFAHRSWSYEETLPWDLIESGLSKKYLQAEDERATEAGLSAPCTESCRGCGLCQSYNLDHQLAQKNEKSENEKPRQFLPRLTVRKVRARFRKEGDLRFISHLDLMRVFERATKRAGLALAFSQGFNPRPGIAFASALALGTTSESEWVDLSLAEPLEPNEVKRRLNEQLPVGIELLEAIEVPLNAPSLMSTIDSAVYLVMAEGLPEDWTEFL